MEIFNEFFGNEAKKEIDLLRYLYKQKRFVTIEEISQALSMDRRSIYKYYDSLVNISLTPQGNHNQIFLTKHGRGYKFVGTKTDYKVLIREILQANPFFHLFETLLLENKVNLTKFAYKNYLSESTVRKRCYELESILKPLGFTLKTTKGSLYLIGDEPRIRYFMVAFFWRTFSGLHWPFPGISQRKCETIAREFYEAHTIPFSEIELKITTYVLAVSVLRFRKGQKIPSDRLSLKPDLTPHDLALFHQLTDLDSPVSRKLNDELREYFLLEENESHFIFLWLQSNLDVSFSKEQLTDYFIFQPTSKQERSYLKRIMYLLTEEYDPQLLTFEKRSLILQTILTGILSVEVFGETIHTLTGYNLYQYVSYNFPNLLIRSQQLLNQVGIYSTNVPKQKGLALHVAVAWSLITPPTTFMKKIKIKLETDLPFSLTLNIKERIETSFQSFYHLDIRRQFENESPDICLSTTPLTETFEKEKIPIVLINAQVSLTDLIAIKQEIEKLIDKEKT
ncbi:helix-turn-helix domain-containing protein [Enterococcus villorum]|uniref:Mga helix-turn-helix domain-containing protein n=3 Tax=Enterococcus villorum TaxID=112904 RepID=A0A511IZZ0_9ENTE|nr:helix-turn-helix domain-containing protein [Enterococcus villorum]EOH89024.1 hypothetical protein UAO_01756 [Enterococcus villorum ATCC 700913]EOW76291.1 hypothetical protein I591_01593 [Enterococcus villorum ATCC 700913]GEL91346.1 hypothetical protein EVI01_06830 [Enterococcus villorum]